MAPFRGGGETGEAEPVWGSSAGDVGQEPLQSLLAPWLKQGCASRSEKAW